MTMLRAVLRGGLWGAAITVFEALILEQWYDIGLRRAAYLPEVGLNGFLYGTLLAAALTIGVRVARRRRPSSSPPGGRRQILGAREEISPIHLVSAVTAFLFSGLATATFFRVHAGWNLFLAVVVAAVAAALIGGVAFVLSQRRGAVVELSLVAIVTVICAWSPMATAVARPSGETRGETPGTNVVLLCIDTCRADFLSCYGGEWPASPTIDSLAVEGTRFERSIAQSSWTLPATASIHTSTYPSQHGATTYDRSMRPGPKRLAAVLSEAGYATAAFSENRFVTPRFGFGDGFETFWAYWSPWVFNEISLYRRTNSLRLPLVHLSAKREFPETFDDPRALNWDAETTTGKAEEWLDRVDGPFFLYVHYMGPHGPYGAPEYLLPEPRPEAPLADHPAEKGGAWPLGPEARAVSDEELHEIELMYAADIAYVDRAIGGLMARLRARGLAETTAVIVTSDHGEEFYDHENWNHGGSVFQEIARVPLVITGPDVTPGGVVTDVVRGIDVAPTVLEFANLDAPSSFEGRSLAPALGGESLPEVPALVEGMIHHPAGARADALITRFHSLLHVSHQGEEAVMLFDLARDPLERNDLAVAQPALRDSLDRALLAWRQRAAAGGGDRENDIRIDGDTREALKGLGYVN